MLANEHERFMRRAIALAADTALVQKAGGVFGAVIVDSAGTIIGEGANRVVAENDPTWHAEMQAIRNACKAISSFKLTGCTLYSAGECCPMCAAALYWAGIARVYYAASVDDALRYGNFDDSMIVAELRKPSNRRSIPTEQLLRDEVIAVWKKYEQMPDRIQY